MTEDQGRTGRKADLRGSVRFHLEEATTLVYRKGLLQSLGLSRTNEARAAVNVSEGGILIRTAERMKTGTEVKIRLDIEKFKDVIEAEGEVCWCVKSTGDDFFAGIRFTTLPRGAASTIARLRGYFTSPEYRSRRAMRRSRDPIPLPT
jgi:Tfp pilus assembly protein PilZ